MQDAGKHPRLKKGFTLIELLIVLVVITFAVGMAGVVFRKGGTLELKSLTKHMASTLRYARTRAVTEKRSYSLLVHDDKRVYALYADLPLDAEEIEEAPLLSREIPESVDVTFEDTENKRIDFYPLGNSNGATVVITNQKGGELFILVNRMTGRVEIKKEPGTD